MSNKHELVPILRFSKFSGNWNVICIEDVLSEIDAGWSPLCKEEQANDGEWGVLKTTAVTWNGFNGSENKKLPSTLKPRPHLEVVHGDILITRAGPIERVGVIAYVSQPRHKLMLSDKLIRITISKNHSSRFISIALGCNQTKRQLLKVKSGLAKAQANISQSIIKNLTLALPVKLEQQKIANFLISVDTKIRQLKRKHTLMQQYKKGVVQQLFSQQVRFKDDDGMDYPAWKEQRLGDFFERVTRKNKKDCKNVMTISAQQGLINQQEYFKKSVSADDVTGYYLMYKGEFAYNKSYSAGYPLGAIKKLNRYDEGVVSTLYICFKAKENVVTEFYEQYFEGGLLNREIQKIAQEGARNHGLLNVSVVEFFRDVVIQLPSIGEQQKISDFLKSIDNKIEQLNTQIIQAETFKKGLLQQMFV